MSTPKTVSLALAMWLASGQRGVSSETIVTYLTGLQTGSMRDVPRDASDLGRCRLLLEQVPELQPKFSRMAELSREWELLVQNWDALCALMDEEAPAWREGKGSAPKTYEWMVALRKQAADQKRRD